MMSQFGVSLVILSLVYLVNCEDAVKTELQNQGNHAAKLDEDPNLENRFGNGGSGSYGGYGSYARGNGYGYANPQRGYQPNQNQPPNFGPQTFQPGQNQNYPITGLGPNGPSGVNGYGGVTYGLGQGPGQGLPPIGSVGNVGNVGQVGQNGFVPADPFDPNFQAGVDGGYIPVDKYHHVNRYHHRHPYRPPGYNQGHNQGHGYGYYYKYGNNGPFGSGQDGKYNPDSFEYGYGVDNIPQDFIRFGQDNQGGQNFDRYDRYDYGSFGSYDDDHVPWTK